MSDDELKLSRRAAAYPTFAADQALSSVRARMPELFAVRDRLVLAARSGTLAGALDQLTPLEALAILAAVQHSAFAATVAALHLPDDDDGDDEGEDDDSDFCEAF